MKPVDSPVGYLNTGVPVGQVAVNVSGVPAQPTKLPRFVAIFCGAEGCVAEITYVAVAEQDVPNEATVRLTTPEVFAVTATA